MIQNLQILGNMILRFSRTRYPCNLRPCCITKGENCYSCSFPKNEFLNIFYTGYALSIYAPLLIISITCLLDLSFEGLYWRYRLPCGNLWQGHWKLHRANPFIFCGLVPLQLSFQWNFPEKNQHESKCKFMF